MLETVSIGEDRKGNEITTCIVRPIETKPVIRNQRLKLKPEERIALDALKNCVAEHGQKAPWASAMDTLAVVTIGQWRTYHLSGAERPPDSKADSYDRNMRRIRERLQANGIIGKKGDFVWPIGS